MKKFIFTFLILNSVLLFAQSNYKLELVGKKWFSSKIWTSSDTTGGSDCWGYIDSAGNDYAIIGIEEGVAFVKVPQMEIVSIVPGPSLNDYYYHRDIKTYKHYAYVTAEMRGTNEGLMIIDLQYLPDSVRYIKSYIYNNNVTSHNLSIDTATGHAYVLNSSASGVRIISLADPINPVDVGFINTQNIHDVYARNDTAFTAEGNRKTFAIYDCANKSTPVLLKRVAIPSSGYVHNIWPTDDGKFVMTTEETKNKTIKLWDISDIQNIDLRGQYLAHNNLAHNTHIKGNLAYISHYTAGVVVVDISNPDTLKEVAIYDTYGRPNTGNFFGNWGAFPFTNGNYVYGSDIEGYLHVFKLVETSPTNISDNQTPHTFSVIENYPNPFNPSTNIKLNIKNDGEFILKIFNSLGMEMQTLHTGRLTAGSHKFEFDAHNFSSGVYVAALISSERIYTKKLLLQK